MQGEGFYVVVFGLVVGQFEGVGVGVYCVLLIFVLDQGCVVFVQCFGIVGCYCDGFVQLLQCGVYVVVFQSDVVEVVVGFGIGQVQLFGWCVMFWVFYVYCVLVVGLEIQCMVFGYCLLCIVVVYGVGEYWCGGGGVVGQIEVYGVLYGSVVLCVQCGFVLCGGQCGGDVVVGGWWFLGQFQGWNGKGN